MKRRIAALAALGALAYAAILVATTPATVLAARVLADTQGEVQLIDARGSLWRGEAKARVFPRRGPPVDIEALSWSFRASRLLAGRVSFDVRLAAAGLQAELEAARSPTAWQLRDLLVRGDASGLATLAPILAALRPAGAIRLDAARLDWDGEQLRGEAVAEWSAAAVGWSEVRPLGSYRANLLAPREGPAQVTVATLEGPLRITGRGTLTPPSSLTFHGEARADAPQAQALAPLMAMLGARRPDGAHAIDWRR